MNVDQDIIYKVKSNLYRFQFVDVIIVRWTGNWPKKLDWLLSIYRGRFMQKTIPYNKV